MLFRTLGRKVGTFVFGTYFGTLFIRTNFFSVFLIYCFVVVVIFVFLGGGGDFLWLRPFLPEVFYWHFVLFLSTWLHFLYLSRPVLERILVNLASSFSHFSTFFAAVTLFLVSFVFSSTKSHLLTSKRKYEACTKYYLFLSFTSFLSFFNPSFLTRLIVSFTLEQKQSPMLRFLDALASLDFKL